MGKELGKLQKYFFAKKGHIFFHLDMNYGYFEPLLHTLKVFQKPWAYKIDLSNEVLSIDFGQGAKKVSEVKVRGQKKYLPTRLTPGAWVRTGPIGRYFF